MALNKSRRSITVGDVVGGRFKLEAELAEGGMSRVYEALDLKHHRPAAIKVLARWLAEDQEFRQRFERESQAAERVTHPHVLPIWDYGEENGLLYLATPLCDLDVGDVISEHGQLPVDRALRITGQVAWALDWAHDRGVVHRDVKPENILLITGSDTDHAYLADFGLARAKVDQTLTITGHPAGLTPAYAAPEQWRGDEVGPAADQYALAATLYTCLSGHPPFHPRRGPSLRDAHLSQQAPDLDGVVRGLPRALCEAVARGLAKEPEDRFDSCREMVAAAQAAALRSEGPTKGAPREPTARGTGAAYASTQISEPPASAPPRHPVPAEAAPAAAQAPPAAPGEAPPAAPGEAPPHEQRRRLPILVGGVVAVVAAIVVAAVLLLGGRDEPGGGGRAGGGGGAETVQVLPTGEGPRALAAGTGGLWVANQSDSSLTRIRPRQGTVHEAAVQAVQQPFGVAVADDRVWAIGGNGALAEVDARSGRRLRQTKLPIPQSDAIAAGSGALWVINSTAGTVTRVDLSSGRPVAQDPVDVGSGPTDIVAGLDAVWVTNRSAGTLVKLDPTTGRISDQVEYRGSLGGVAVDEEGVWVANPSRGRIIRFNPLTGRSSEISVGRPGSDADVAAGNGAVFYVDADRGTARRVDPRSRKPIGDAVRVADHPGGAVVVANGLWVTDTGRDEVARLEF